jgi:very-short-patch-repair endonuclease
MTEEERLIWSCLRRRRCDGCRFRRQVPIGPYFADFASFERKIVIELDGSQHAAQTEYDDRRTRFFEQRGYRVLRFWNYQVKQDLDAVVEGIEMAAVRRRNVGATGSEECSTPPRES